MRLDIIDEHSTYSTIGVFIHCLVSTDEGEILWTVSIGKLFRASIRTLDGKCLVRLGGYR